MLMYPEAPKAVFSQKNIWYGTGQCDCGDCLAFPPSIPSIWHKTWGHDAVENTLPHMFQLGLLAPQHEPAAQKKIDAHTLVAWLHVTDHCNLRCSYCYVPHRLVDMSMKTGKAAIDATFRSAAIHGYQHVHLKYSGGEPLLRFPAIEALHYYANERARKFGLVVAGTILSNGTLVTSEILQSIQALNLQLTISLDGLGAYHNCQRAYSKGYGSFSDVIQAVNLALQHQVTPFISVVVTGKNAEGLPEFMNWLIGQQLPFKLNICREGGYHSDLEEEKIILGMLEAYKVIEARLPQQRLLASLIDLSNFSASFVKRCSVGQSYLVFDCQGRISKCQMQMNQPVTDIHAKDPLAAIQNDSCGIQNLSVDEKEGCQGCQWRYWCAGGCPLETFKATGRYDLKSPYCNIYKALYPEVLRLEGLRLLKYNST